MTTQAERFGSGPVPRLEIGVPPALPEHTEATTIEDLFPREMTTNTTTTNITTEEAQPPTHQTSRGEPTVKEIRLENSSNVALVDDADYPLVNRYEWRERRRRG